MTDTEWVTCSNYRSLERELYDKATGRKSQLFACACCRLCWHLMAVACRRRVEAIERFADGEVGLGEVRELFRFNYGQVALSFLPGGNQAAEATWHLGWRLKHGNNPSGWNEATCSSRSAAEALAKSIHWQEARKLETDLLRCVFGNPFRPVSLNSDWRTTTVLQLSQQMYDSRDFSAMPILADALQDAECENTDVLDHCREPGPHVRGCWVVDLLLGKS